ncbi:hypothetical protein R1flu_011876 [Riccia fluitans]|uniref:Uncharacterized protein n=1 Tax=Riccia fluitans TaxID=41844 RepID=A0ABD1ZA72_9MARC
MWEIIQALVLKFGPSNIVILTQVDMADISRAGFPVVNTGDTNTEGTDRHSKAPTEPNTTGIAWGQDLIIDVLNHQLM